MYYDNDDVGMNVEIPYLNMDTERMSTRNLLWFLVLAALVILGMVVTNYINFKNFKSDNGFV